jgi:hypothetical protein
MSLKGYKKVELHRGRCSRLPKRRDRDHGAQARWLFEMYRVERRVGVEEME